MTSRKNFLVAGGIAAAGTLASANAATPAPSNANSIDGVYTFDRARFTAIAGKPALHRHCFSATAPSGGRILFSINNTLNAWRDALHEDRTQINVAAVLYGGNAVTIGLNDAVWNDLLWPSHEFTSKSLGIESETGVGPGKGNPFYPKSPASGDVSVQGLSENGVSFFLCNNHLIGMADEMAPKLGKAKRDIYRQLVLGAVPGGLVVPAGVWAVNALQEFHFTLLQVST